MKIKLKVKVNGTWQTVQKITLNEKGQVTCIVTARVGWPSHWWTLQGQDLQQAELKVVLK